MMKFIQTLQAKPSDSTIRLIRALFSLLTLLVLGLAIEYDVLIVEFSLPKELVYFLFTFPLIGLIRAIFDPGIFRRKIWKWTNVTL